MITKSNSFHASSLKQRNHVVPALITCINQYSKVGPFKRVASWPVLIGKRMVSCTVSAEAVMWPLDNNQEEYKNPTLVRRINLTSLCCIRHLTDPAA